MFRIAPVVASLIALTALTMLVPASSEAGELPPRQDKIVYTCSFDFVLDICSINPDGTDEVMLTDDAAFDEYPELSPGGRQVAWEKNLGEVWVMNSDGSNEHRVLGGDGLSFPHRPTWSPDGRMLAFSCAVGGEVGICTANADGSSDNSLVAPLQGASEPDWSPDGTKIIFQAQEVGENHSDIYVVTLSSGAIVNLTNTPLQSEAFPRWSPDGTKFAFWSAAPEGDPSPSAIDTANANGSGRDELFPNAPVSSPAWSPDGTQIAVICDDVPGQGREMCLVDSIDGDLIDTIEADMGHQTETWADPSWATTGGTQQGDIDCNGSADPIDALKLLRFDAGLSASHNDPCLEIGDEVTINDLLLAWGDVDCNGLINPVDALKVLRYDAGLEVQQEPNCPDMGEFVT